MESCEDEGVAVTEEVVDRLVSEFQCTSLADAVKAIQPKQMTVMVKAAK